MRGVNMKVYYWKDISWLTFFSFNEFEENKPISIPEQVFLKEWVELPIIFNEQEFAFPDNVFAQLNNPENPMGTHIHQSWIRDNGLHHTSFSVGDMAKMDNGNLYVCLNAGWRKVIMC
jgi:hypothetical protein